MTSGGKGWRRYLDDWVFIDSEGPEAPFRDKALRDSPLETPEKPHALIPRHAIEPIQALRELKINIRRLTYCLVDNIGKPH